MLRSSKFVVQLNSLINCEAAVRKFPCTNYFRPLSTLHYKPRKHLVKDIDAHGRWNERRDYSSWQQNYNYRNQTIAVVLVAGTTAALAWKRWVQSDAAVLCEESIQKEWPVFTRAEVAKHKTREDGIWVTYKNKVYDITSFIAMHPGGASKIMLAAGQDLQPFWDMYAQHKESSILDNLNKDHLIGVLHEDDHAEEKKKEGPYSNDPKRHPALLTNSMEPFNSETPTALACDSLITPTELFYVRNHLPVPDVLDVDAFRLRLAPRGDTGGSGGESAAALEIEISVDELRKKYPQHHVTAAMQCAGNRRSEMNPVKQVKGLSWAHNAIANAEWTGALLSDVLRDAGVDPDDPRVKHVQFEGLDKGPDASCYGASIPADRIFQRGSKIMIAYEMNGKPISRDHGFPLRLVAPGIVGARNVKWLSRVVVSDEESESHWQRNDYKSFSPNIDWDNVDFTSMPAIQELPVTSAICSPGNGTSVDEEDGTVTCKGYAYSGGGHGIIRVDASSDNGRTWHTASLTQSDEPLDRMYSWTIWEVDVPIPENHDGTVELVCKATDTSCNTQPENVGPVWNLRGVLNNSWHRLLLNVVKEE